MAKKKKNSRKALAVALGIMGIAGLSMASASNLNITTNPQNIATGLGAFTSACDDAVTAKYTTTTSGVLSYDTIEVTGIASGCYGKDLTWTLNYASSPAGVAASQTGTVALTGSGSVDFAKTIDFTDLAVKDYSLTDLALTIK